MFQAIVDRHDILRSAIRCEADEPWQEMLGAVLAVADLDDLTELDPGERE